MTASPAPARVLVFLFITAVLVNLSKNYPDVAEDQLVVQRQVINAVHEIFPEPVPYIDRNSMIASFPKVGLFMSTWGMEAYHDAGKPIFEDILRTSAPPFLLANHPALFLDSAVPPLRTLGAYRLMERDVEVLTSNFVHHWGPIYVAGKRALISPVAPITMEVIVPGTYTLESRSSVLVQGVLHQPGDLLRLGQGAYELLGTDTVDVVTLRWGANLKRPAGLAPTGVLYYPLERS